MTHLQELKLSFSDKELISYLVDREREILRLQHCVANNSNRETDKVYHVVCTVMSRGYVVDERRNSLRYETEYCYLLKLANIV